MWGDQKSGLICPKCGNIAIKLIKKLPPRFKQKYPNGVCRRCKREYINYLRKLMDEKKQKYPILNVRV